MSLFRNAFGVVVTFGAVTFANACSLAGLTHTVAFPKSSAAIPASEVRGLANWYVGLRDGMGVEYAVVVAVSAKGSEKSGSIARDRMDGVTSLLKTLAGGNPIPVKTSLEQLVKPPLDPNAYEEIIVLTQPKCAKTNSCCPEPSR